MKNEFKLGGRKVDLSKITMPVLNVYADEDHIIPPSCSRRWRRSSARRITRRSLPGGHVGVFVGGKSQGCSETAS